MTLVFGSQQEKLYMTHFLRKRILLALGVVWCKWHFLTVYALKTRLGEPYLVWSSVLLVYYDVYILGAKIEALYTHFTGYNSSHKKLLSMFHFHHIKSFTLIPLGLWRFFSPDIHCHFSFSSHLYYIFVQYSSTL